MPGGPIFPHSIAIPSNGRVGMGPHVGSTNSRRDEGVQVEASLGADSLVEYRFQMPPTSVPSGQAKVRLIALANATSGSAQVTVEWASVNMGSSPDTVVLGNEGTQTITWAGGEADVYKETKVDLNLSAVGADDEIVLELTFATAGWSLAQVSTWIVSIIWE